MISMLLTTAQQFRAIQNGRTLVPIRAIAESFGADVKWDGAAKTVTISLDGKVLNMVIGQRVEGMEAPPMIINGRTMIPLRFISEYFDANVIYDDATREISIYR